MAVVGAIISLVSGMLLLNAKVSPVQATQSVLLEPRNPGIDEKRPANTTGIFGSLEIRTNAARGAEKWPKVMARIKRERTLYERCKIGGKGCASRLQKWRRLIARSAKLSRWQKIVEVNRFVNTLVRYRSDARTYGRADHWATPVETLRGAGDCEDYAILKHESLRELGFSVRDMKLVVVLDKRRGVGHAVLAVKHGEGIYILDNQEARPLEHSVVRRYRPIYSVNSTGQWLALQVNNLAPRVASVKPTLQLPQSTSEPSAKQSSPADYTGLKIPSTNYLTNYWGSQMKSLVGIKIFENHKNNTLNDNRIIFYPETKI